MGNVYFVQQPHPGKDLSSSQRYGTIRPIFTDPNFQPSLQPGKALDTLRESLQSFDPEADFLVFAGGDPCGALMAGRVFQELHPNKVMPTLRWERERDITGERRTGIGFYAPVYVRSA